MSEAMVYSSAEMVERIWDKENVTMLLNRHAYLCANNMGREAINNLWVQCEENRKTASIARNNGYYVGMDEVARHLVVDRTKALEDKLRPYVEADSNLALDAMNYGIGVACMDTVTTPLVYISDDGRSARYLGYRLGFQATGFPDGRADCYMDFGLVFADLLKEDGEWKIWHLILEHDHTVTVGEDYGKTPIFQSFGEDPLELQFGVPTVEFPVYQPIFGWEYMWNDMPRPYVAYSDKESYGPKGDVGKPYYQRERR